MCSLIWRIIIHCALTTAWHIHALSQFSQWPTIISIFVGEGQCRQRDSPGLTQLNMEDYNWSFKSQKNPCFHRALFPDPCFTPGNKHNSTAFGSLVEETECLWRWVKFGGRQCDEGLLLAGPDSGSPQSCMWIAGEASLWIEHCESSSTWR